MAKKEIHVLRLEGVIVDYKNGLKQSRREEQDDAKFRQDLDEHWSFRNTMDLWQDENCSQVSEGWNDNKLSVGSKGDCMSEQEDARLC